MSMLKGVTTGKIKKNIFCILYGPDGVGKSTFGADAPNPIFLGTEDGTSNLDVARFPKPESFSDCIQAIRELSTEPHQYKTLVIDSLDWLEPLLWRQICQEDGRAQSIEQVGGGYGKGYTYALEYWDKMIQQLKTLRDKMHIVCLAHSQIKQFQDPQTSVGYDRYQLKLNDKASAKWREAVEAVLFGNWEVFAKEERGRTKAIGDGRRLIYTERRPAYDAKNRYGLPLTIPLSWDEFYAAVQRGEPDKVEAILFSINTLLESVTDKEKKATILATVEQYKSDAVMLGKILDRVRSVVEDQK